MLSCDFQGAMVEEMDSQIAADLNNSEELPNLGDSLVTIDGMHVVDIHQEEELDNHEEVEATSLQPGEMIPEAPEEFKPKIGKEFDSEDAARCFYDAYGRWCGFRIRKGQVAKTVTGDRRMRIFMCSKEGHRLSKYTEAKDRKRKEKAVTRCGCPAMIRINRKKKTNVWVVTAFVETHNHILMNSNRVHCLPSHIYVPNLHNVQKVGICPTEELQSFAIEAGRLANLGFLNQDDRNALRQQRRGKYVRGVQSLLNYFADNHTEDSKFLYSIEFDNESRLTSCFWTDRRSIRYYEVFGDVICFDTTYKTNELDMPFGIFVGVNHHLQTTSFGAGLLFDELIENFEWLFQTWLQMMGGKHPKVFITDQDPAIIAAVRRVFPDVDHRIFMWHIDQMVSEKLGQIIDTHQSFNTDWGNCVHQTVEIDKFESLWLKMMKDYGLEEVNWLQDLYKIRDKWVPSYVKGAFLAGMSTAQRSKSVITFFDYVANHNSTLLEFAKGYEDALKKQRCDEREADIETLHNTPEAFTMFELELEMAGVYTRKVFKAFQDELIESVGLVARLVDNGNTWKKHEVFDCKNKDEIYIVEWKGNHEMSSCSCQFFEFCGIVCRHLLFIFRNESISKMPEQYILNRWTRKATEKCQNGFASHMSDLDDLTKARHNDLSHAMNFLVNEGSKTEEAFKIVKSHLDAAIEAVREANQNDKETIASQNKVSDYFFRTEERRTSNVYVNIQPSTKFMLHDPNVVHSEEQETKERLKPCKQDKDKVMSWL